MSGSSALTLGDSLVSTEWLASALGSPGLVVFDCTCILKPDPNGGLMAESARPNYEEAHIPGAGFLDITGDLSDNKGAYRFTMPTPEDLAQRFGEHGIGDGTAVVLYARDNPSWATRMWWMLRVAGFDNAAVLDGGLAKWIAEGRPTETGSVTLPPATLTPHPRPELVAGRAEVMEAMKGGCVINALSPEQHRGEGASPYGRAGRIPGSSNVPTMGLIDPATKTFKSDAEIKGMLDGSGAFKADTVVPYCGGGIAASVTAFWLAKLGHPNVKLYDNSLSEWAADPDLPIEVG